MPDAIGRYPEACCHKCWDAISESAEYRIHRPFIVCSICGNKRCPKATDHDLDCTKSNATGQKGSIYE